MSGDPSTGVRALMPVKPTPEGFHTLTPYVTVAGVAKLLGFLKQAFGAEEVHRPNCLAPNPCRRKWPMSDLVHILGIPGSLRKASYNRAALSAAQELVPADATLEIFDLAGIPPFNEDDERTLPTRVAELKAKIREADAILFATAEYNYSIPGVLKNAIDWASRPYGDNAWDGKPVAIMGASVGLTGTARAQYHLRQTFVFLNMHPLNRPEVMISSAHQRFDDHGALVDATSRKRIGELLEALVAWTRRLGKGS